MYFSMVMTLSMLFTGCGAELTGCVSGTQAHRVTNAYNGRRPALSFRASYIMNKNCNIITCLCLSLL